MEDCLSKAFKISIGVIIIFAALFIYYFTFKADASKNLPIVLAFFMSYGILLLVIAFATIMRALKKWKFDHFNTVRSFKRQFAILMVIYLLKLWDLIWNIDVYSN
jgi:ABC-type nickel/cobalt efflux system permease component RcnA